jgi:exopolyphosphatase/guanosine-5'-triphosphate,3'-diphosphate pyrophosphatase
MIAAALDLGSNTLRLLVAEVEAGQYRDLARGLATPRLGRGLVPGGPLNPEARQAARQQASAFVSQARGLGAQRIALAATQACRLAADGADFVAGLGRELGLEAALVINGEQEAALSRAGVLSRLEGPAQDAVLADVGGGSTELAALDGSWTTSLPLGAVALTEAHLAHDPPSPAEMEALADAVERGLSSLANHRAARMVATAGTAATVGAMLLGMEVYEPGRVNNLNASLGQLEQQLSRLAALPLAQRQKAPGLEPERADIILAGMAILRGLLRVLQLDRMTVMDAGLLEGILLELAAA